MLRIRNLRETIFISNNAIISPVFSGRNANCDSARTIACTILEYSKKSERIMHLLQKASRYLYKPKFHANVTPRCVIFVTIHALKHFTAQSVPNRE